MAFYSNIIFPRILDFAMRGPEMNEQRELLLREVSGDVFEIGFGTGLNLRYYPDTVKKVTTVDPNPGCSKLAQRRIEASGIEVDSHLLRGEELPFADASFDSVVCTWTLCSIPEVEQALGQMRRVLRPGGRLFFIEHGRADDPKVGKWQDRLTPYWKKIGDGCHLNRKMDEIIQDCRFRFLNLENFYLPKSPRWAGYMYRGIAAPA